MDTLLFETSPADVFITLQGKSGFFAEVWDNKTSEPDNEEESAKECEGEEKKEVITLSKTLDMTAKLQMYCLRKRFRDAHPQVPSTRNSITNFTTKNPQQS